MDLKFTYSRSLNAFRFGTIYRARQSNDLMTDSLFNEFKTLKGVSPKILDSVK